MLVRDSLLSALIATGFLFSLHVMADEEQQTSGSHRTSQEVAASAPRKVKKDTELTEKTAKLGGDLFVRFAADADKAKSFRSMVQDEKWPLKYENKNLTEAINQIKPRKNEDGSLKLTKVRDEVPVAKFIARLMVNLGDKSWSKGYDLVEELHNKFKQDSDSDSQFESFAERLRVAMRNWGKEKGTDKDIDNKPKEEWLVPFYTAFKEAKKEAQEIKAEQEKNIALAKDGNEAAFKKLVGDPKNPDPNAEANKLALGKDMPQVIAQMFKDGQDARAQELVQALSKPTKGHFNINGENGTPLSVEIPQKPEAIKNTFLDPAMAKAQFVGNEHAATSFPLTMAWNGKDKKLEQKPGQAAPPVDAALQAAQPSATGARTAQTQPDAQSQTSGDVNRGLQVWNTKCLECHSQDRKSAAAARGAVDSGKMPKGKPPLSTQERNDLLAFLGSGS